MKKVGIIGGGPSGIMAAIWLKKILNNNIDVTIFEKKDKIGKKILASGNGKCNLSNINLTQDCYNDSFISNVINNYSPSVLIDVFKTLGLLTTIDSSGRVYPITLSANSLLNVLLRNLNKYQVTVKTDSLVTKIDFDKKYILTCDQNQYYFDYLILATGGTSASKLGSNGEGYKLVKPFNIKVTKIYPGLVGLKVNQFQIKGLDGIRQKAKVTLLKNEKVIFNEEGEVQFKKDGVSGIVIMDASRYIKDDSQYQLKLDLLPSLSELEIINFLKEQLDNGLEVALKGILPKMLSENIAEKGSDLKTITKLIKEFPLNIIGTYGFENSQVTLGGISLEEITPSFELKKLTNCYAIGELINIDGKCGGYNLHYAFSSGIVVANHIINKELTKGE